MTLKYESELLFDLMKRDGDDTPSDVLPYESELKEKYLEQVEGAYPKLQDYRPEWLYYNLYYHIPADFPVESVSNVTNATFENVVPYAYKSATLKGSTKYRDIDTGDILDTFDETKNLELVSVKVPVLTTTGKNIVNEKIWEIETEEEEYQCLLFDGFVTTDLKNGNPIIIPVNVKKGKKYTLKCKNKATSYFNYFYLIDDLIDGKVKTNKTRIAENITKNSFVDTIATFTADGDYKYLHIDTGSPEAKGYIVKNTLQLEESSSATTYEPYQSNILTVNEEVELRGIGDVKDELNLITGELTQRIGEIVLDGSEKWTKMGESQNNPNLIIYYSTNALPNSIINTNIILCDKFKTSNTMAWHSSEEDIYVSTSTYGLRICLDSGKLESTTVDGLKKWLTENNPIIQYQLATESVKTVDLTAAIRPIEGTMHVSTSSQTLPPLLDMSVPVEAITQNLMSFANIEEEEK